MWRLCKLLPFRSLFRVLGAAVRVPVVVSAATTVNLSVGPQASVDAPFPAVGPPRRAIASTRGRRNETRTFLRRSTHGDGSTHTAVSSYRYRSYADVSP